MRLRLLAAFGLVAALGAAGACALDIPDVIVEGGVDANGGDSSGGDAKPSDVNVVDVPVINCDGSCAPTGWTPALFATDRSSQCPSTMQTLDLAADPGAVPNSACTCDCNITTQPQCVPTTLQHEIQTFNLDGGTPICNTGGTPIDVDGGCDPVPDSGMLNIHYAWEGNPFLPVEAGTCSSNPTGNASAVPVTASRLCVDTTCQGTCAPSGNFKACLYAQGDVPCPSNYTQPHKAGTVDLSCAACTKCGVAGGVCEGTVSLYFDTNCTNKIIDVAMDGGCASTGNANGQIAQSLKYTPQVVATVCNPGKSNGGTATLTGEITVCCP